MIVDHSSGFSMSSEEAAARSGLYKLLARIWLQEVDLQFLLEIQSSPTREAFLSAGGILPERDDEQTIELLAIDYCQLFLGPKDHLPPFQCVWQGGQFQGAATQSIKEFIEIVGYNMDQLPDGLMPDHLGVQLDVMGHILDQIAIWQSTPEDLTTVWDLGHSFFERHLMWPVELLEAAEQRATTDFYRSTIILTRDFLKSEMST